MKHSVAGIIVIEHRLFIAKRFPHGNMGGRWEFPGGKVEEGESFIHALIREYNEEFSFSVTVGDFITEAEFIHDSEKVGLHAFEVFLSDPLSVPVFTEHTQISWSSVSEIECLSFVDSDLMLLPGIKAWLQK